MATITRTIDAGPVGIMPKGEYNNTTTYGMLDEVLYDYDSWYSIKDNNLNHTPTDGSEWWTRGTSGGRTVKDKVDKMDTSTTAADKAAASANHAAQFANVQGDYAKEWNDHPPYIADGTTEHRGDPYYMYLWDISTHAYVRGAYIKGADIDYSTMTAEEYNRLVENVKSSILFATVDTCENIIDELT